MNTDISEPTVRIGGHPVLRILVSFPIACFSGALMTDLAYARSADVMWADFSAWLLAAGIVTGVLTAIVGFFDIVVSRRGRAERPGWPLLAIGGLVVLVLGFVNNLVHSRDAWTSVVPEGLVLSAITLIVVLFTAWRSSRTVFRRDFSEPYPGVRQ